MVTSSDTRRDWAPGLTQIGDGEVIELSDMFKMMGDPSRLRIILTCLDMPRSVGAIAETLGLSASLVSHHLRLLRAARLLRADRRGKQIFYGLADEHIRTMLLDMVAHVAEPHHEPDGV